MADNYLEKKMEELRNGTAARTFHAGAGRGAAGSRKGGMQFAFPPKRVLIASGNPWVEEMARVFVRTESKVALLSANLVLGERLASQGGVRYLPVTEADCRGRAGQETEEREVVRHLTELFKAWRDLDILIADSEQAAPVISFWQKHRERFPYISDYICRIILLTGKEALVAVNASNPVNASQVIDASQAEKLRATVNVISSDDYSADISTLVATLCLPANSILNGNRFEV